MFLNLDPHYYFIKQVKDADFQFQLQIDLTWLFLFQLSQFLFQLIDALLYFNQEYLFMGLSKCLVWKMVLMKVIEWRKKNGLKLKLKMSFWNCDEIESFI